jgi:hypothetical protein
MGVEGNNIIKWWAVVAQMIKRIIAILSTQIQ